MSIRGKDKEFRIPKISYIDYKHIEMDRVLTMFFPRLKYDGYTSRRPARSNDLEIDKFTAEFLDHPEWFTGFGQYPHIVQKWIETELMDVVNRGKANQSFAAPRPLHGNTYKFRNARHTRDYNASEQLYWMFFFARKGRGQVLGALKRFFFPAIDMVTDRYNPNISVDVETQALLRLDSQVKQDAKDSKEPVRVEPLCIGQADILADDILRLLAYENFMPRSVMVDYMKTLIAFHLALYHIKLLKILPGFVKRHCGNTRCGIASCPVNPGFDDAMDGCPYQLALVVDMGDGNNPQMTQLAQQSAEGIYRKIPAFIQANFAVKKLDEMADYLSHKTGKLMPPANGLFGVQDLVALQNKEYDALRKPYFEARQASVIEEIADGSGDDDPEIKGIMEMNLDPFDSYIEILMTYRGRFHRQYITECLDSLLLKNKENGLLTQPRVRDGRRRFVMGSKLLEVLLQIAVLSQEDGRFLTRDIRVEDLLDFLRNRYGLYIDRLPEDEQSVGIAGRRALRLNAEAFKRRLREIGFFEDLSDAYITQQVSPRYVIRKADIKITGGRSS